MTKARLEIIKQPKHCLDGKYNTFCDYCTCPMFKFTGMCSHVKALLAQIADKTPEPQPQP